MREECFVTEETAGDRIDKFLAEQYEDLSRSFLQKLLKSGEVMVNGRPVKASYKAAEGDTISFEVPEAVEPEIVPEDIQKFIDETEQKVIDGEITVGTAFDMSTDEVAALRDSMKP